MDSGAIAYLVFGVTLVVLFGAIIGYYYSKKRKNRGEEPKYKMLDDDE